MFLNSIAKLIANGFHNIQPFTTHLCNHKNIAESTSSHFNHYDLLGVIEYIMPELHHLVARLPENLYTSGSQPLLPGPQVLYKQSWSATLKI